MPAGKDRLAFQREARALVRGLEAFCERFTHKVPPVLREALDFIRELEGMVEAPPPLLESLGVGTRVEPAYQRALAQLTGACGVEVDDARLLLRAVGYRHIRVTV
jgi:hypothetical protein